VKVKTSISLSEDLIRQVDSLAGRFGNRSALIEKAVREFLANQAERKRNARDLEILNKRADALNEEALDVLAYQVDI